MSPHTPSSGSPTDPMQREILPEVLGEIFGWVFAYNTLYKMGRLEIVDLMLVCRHWHDVIRQTPHLWSRVCVLLSRPINYEKLVAWLSRAGTTEKSLRVVNSNMYDFCPCGRLGEASGNCHLRKSGLAQLLATGPPLEYFILPTLPSSCFEYLIQSLSDLEERSSSSSWQSISCLALSFGRGYHVEPTRTSGSIFNSLPLALTSLDLRFALSDNQLPSRYEIPPPTLRRLRSFNIDCHWHITRIADILCHCTNLRHLTIRHCSSVVPQIPIRLFPKLNKRSLSQVDPIPLPRLCSLDLAILDPDYSAYLLRRLFTPSLVEVRIHHDENALTGQHIVWDSLKALKILTPGPGNPSIRSLTIYDLNLYMDGPRKLSTRLLVSLLACLPHLTHLRFENVAFNAEELLGVVEGIGAERRKQVAPRVETIELVKPGDDFQLESLLRYMMGSDGARRLELRLGGNASQYPRLCDLYEKSPMVGLAQSEGIVMDLYK